MTNISFYWNIGSGFVYLKIFLKKTNKFYECETPFFVFTNSNIIHSEIYADR